MQKYNPDDECLKIKIKKNHSCAAFAFFDVWPFGSLFILASRRSLFRPFTLLDGAMPPTYTYKFIPAINHYSTVLCNLDTDMHDNADMNCQAPRTQNLIQLQVGLMQFRMYSYKKWNSKMHKILQNIHEGHKQIEPLRCALSYLNVIKRLYMLLNYKDRRILNWRIIILEN